MLVSANAARKNLRNPDVRDDGESEVDRSGSGRVLLISQQLISVLGWLMVGAQCEDKCEHTLLVVHQNLPGRVHVSRLHSPERHC